MKYGVKRKENARPIDVPLNGRTSESACITLAMSTLDKAITSTPSLLPFRSPQSSKEKRTIVDEFPLPNFHQKPIISLLLNFNCTLAGKSWQKRKAEMATTRTNEIRRVNKEKKKQRQNLLQQEKKAKMEGVYDRTKRTSYLVGFLSWELSTVCDS